MRARPGRVLNFEQPVRRLGGAVLKCSIINTGGDIRN